MSVWRQIHKAVKKQAYFPLDVHLLVPLMPLLEQTALLRTTAGQSQVSLDLRSRNSVVEVLTLFQQFLPVISHSSYAPLIYRMLIQYQHCSFITVLVLSLLHSYFWDLVQTNPVLLNIHLRATSSRSILKHSELSLWKYFSFLFSKIEVALLF